LHSHAFENKCDRGLGDVYLLFMVILRQLFWQFYCKQQKMIYYQKNFTIIWMQSLHDQIYI